MPLSTSYNSLSECNQIPYHFIHHQWLQLVNFKQQELKFVTFKKGTGTSNFPLKREKKKNKKQMFHVLII